jgi:hypothetical protein
MFWLGVFTAVMTLVYIRVGFVTSLIHRQVDQLASLCTIAGTE